MSVVGRRASVWGWALVCFCCWTLQCLNARADDTWVYAVQVHAEVSTSPPAITLKWTYDSWGAASYTVYRKTKQASNWGQPLAVLPGSALAYLDANVARGEAYEYKVFKQGTLGYTGYGYIYAGIESPAVESRGKLILIVETNATAQLQDELNLLRSDLRGDGWQIIEHGVSSSQTPESVKALIRADYQADPANVNTLFLLGHVPVLHSGNIDWDTHGLRPVPTDSYYGDMDGNWPTDPAQSPGYLPSDVELMIGRVDFFDMPGIGGHVPWPSETELLRNYLRKDHEWRHKLFTVPYRALMGNGRGDEGGGAAASSGYRNFDPLVGPDAVTEAGVAYTTPPAERWISYLAREPYLIAYGCGGGSANGCGAMGTNFVAGNPGYLESTDVFENDAKAVFVMMFGSWFGQFDLQDNLVRSFLATKSFGLASCLAGRPHWFIHHMGLGETIGYGARASMNNLGLYGTYSNAMARAVYVALMGDPTLRLHVVKPPANLQSATGARSVALSWQASQDAVLGYNVYRAPRGSQEFTRINSQTVDGTSYTDISAPPGALTYMVRAVALQQSASGTYYNLSQGIFSDATGPDSTPVAPIQVNARTGPQGVILSWNAQPILSYVVLVSNDAGTTWTTVTGELTPSGSEMTWSDQDSYASAERFYRVTAIRK